MKKFVRPLAFLALLAVSGCASGGAPFFMYDDNGALDPNCPAAKVEAVASSIPIYGGAVAAALGLVGTLLHLGQRQVKKTADAASAKVDAHVAEDHSGDGTCVTCGGAVTVQAAPPVSTDTTPVVIA